jgi:glycosyltransferase involved in cell wall biosynthesis
MYVCIVGGIYGADALLRNTMLRTPEILLERALRMRGYKVTALDLYTRDLPPADIVHVHHLAMGTVRIAAMRRRPPLVYTSHDSEALCDVQDGMKRLVARQFVFSRAQAVVALSDTEYEFQETKYRIRGAAHRVIPNGIEETLFPFRPRTRHEDLGRPWRLLFIGQLNSLKGVDILLRAMARSTHPLELQLIYQNSQLETYLKDLAADLGVARNVHFCGPVPYDRLSEYHRSADLLMVPSTAESLPSVVSEALFSGLPVVATTVGGIPWQLRGDGVLCPPGDADALWKAIDTAICNYPLLSERAEEVSKRARKRFSVDGMVDAHIALYEAALQSRRPQTSSWVDGLRALTAQLRD